MESKIKHLMHVPFTGLGLFGGFRGNRWLRNRIKVFKQFVIPSFQAQTNQDFVIWCSWRPEEKYNPLVKEFVEKFPDFVHTFHGICFWDDKYSDQEARVRLLNSLHGTMGELVDEIGDVDYVLMTIQPSDDCYHRTTVEVLQKSFAETDLQAIGFERGYIMNYLTKELAEYNPNTNPPFFTIKFPKAVFINPLQHAEYTGPYKSHEYIKDHLKYGTIKERGFIVGTHGENISTTFVHPFKGEIVSQEILKDFGLANVKPLEIKTSWRRAVLRRLPHKIQRKLRYWLGEIIWQRMYEFLRS